MEKAKLQGDEDEKWANVGGYAPYIGPFFGYFPTRGRNPRVELKKG
jgi:hypothetical protein